MFFPPCDECLDGRWWCVIQGCGPGCNVADGLFGLVSVTLVLTQGLAVSGRDSTWDMIIDKLTGPEGRYGMSLMSHFG